MPKYSRTKCFTSVVAVKIILQNFEIETLTFNILLGSVFNFERNRQIKETFFELYKTLGQSTKTHYYSMV